MGFFELPPRKTDRQCALLWFCEVLSRELYRELGYPSMEQYATLSLGFSRNRTWQFMRLARDLERLPPVKIAVANGQLAWTKAQQVTRIATPHTRGGDPRRDGRAAGWGRSEGTGL